MLDLVVLSEHVPKDRTKVLTCLHSTLVTHLSEFVYPFSSFFSGLNHSLLFKFLEGWESYMDQYVGSHGIITDPDMTINDPDALVEISLDEKGTHRFPQDCFRPLED